MCQAVVEIKVPKSVKKNLLENEQVIGKTSSMWGPDFYATNKRLIKRRRSVVGEALVGVLAPKAHFFDVEYSRIVSIIFHRHRPLPRVIVGILVGSILIGLGIFFFLLPPPHEYYRGPDPRVFGGGFFLVLGLFFGGLLCGVRESYYQINIHDTSNEELKEWRIIRPPLRKKRTESFVSMVRDKMSQRS